MIHSATQSAKFLRLVRRLRPLVDCPAVCCQTVAVGLLERIWHTSIDSAPCGDLGKIDNETLAEMVGWLGDADQLIELLVETGWLDRDPVHRLLVHDWPEHCPAFIKKNIGRKGGFAKPSSDEPVAGRKAAQRRNGAKPKTGGKRLSGAGKSSQSGSGEPVSGGKVAQNGRLDSTPNITEPNPTEPNKTKPADSALDFSVTEVFWGTEPIGWLAFDWMAAGRQFVATWNGLPGGVIKSRLKDLPSDLDSWFRERWANSEWRTICREAFAKIEQDGGLKSGTRLALKNWLAQESLADSVLGGRYDFVPGGNSKKENRDAGSVYPEDYEPGGSSFIDPAEVAAAKSGGDREFTEAENRDGL